MLTAPIYAETDLTATCIGLGLTGFHLGPLMVLALPEMIDAIKQKYPNQNIEHATNVLSGYANCAMGVGSSLGPIYGAFLLMQFGFRVLLLTTATFLLAIALITTVIDCFAREEEHQYNDLDKMNNEECELT